MKPSISEPFNSRAFNKDSLVENLTKQIPFEPLSPVKRLTESQLPQLSSKNYPTTESTVEKFKFLTITSKAWEFEDFYGLSSPY